MAEPTPPKAPAGKKSWWAKLDPKRRQMIIAAAAVLVLAIVYLATRSKGAPASTEQAEKEAQERQNVYPSAQQYGYPTGAEGGGGAMSGAEGIGPEGVEGAGGPEGPEGKEGQVGATGEPGPPGAARPHTKAQREKAKHKHRESQRKKHHGVGPAHAVSPTKFGPSADPRHARREQRQRQRQRRRKH